MKIKTKADAAEALGYSEHLKSQAETLMAKHGITKLLEKAESLKDKATDYCVSKGIDRLDLEDGRYGKLIESAQERIIVGTRADIPVDAPVALKPLKSLVSKELWMKITRRVPDVDKIEQAISDGLLTIDEIQPSYYERMRKPYIRVFGGKND
jgi:hypothetical protein